MRILQSVPVYPEPWERGCGTAMMAVPHLRSSIFEALRHSSGLSAYEIRQRGDSQHVSSEQRHKESSSRSLLFLRSATLLQSTPV
jgi:hypothetical protein